MTALYRHFDADGNLLYIGISLSALTRLGQHERNAHWYSKIKRVEIENFPTRKAALEAEKAAIHSEKPYFNIQLNIAKDDCKLSVHLPDYLYVHAMIAVRLLKYDNPRETMDSFIAGLIQKHLFESANPLEQLKDRGHNFAQECPTVAKSQNEVYAWAAAFKSEQLQ